MRPAPDHVYHCHDGPNRLVVEVTASSVMFIEEADDGQFHLRGEASTESPELFKSLTRWPGAPVGLNRLVFEK